MRYSVRLSIGALLLVAAGACSAPTAKPAMTEDLQRDLAKVGAGDVQLAGAAAPRVDVVSSAERTDRNVPTPKAPRVSRVATATPGTRAPARSPRHVTPAPAQARATADETAPAEAPRAEPAPEPVPSQQRPQQAPVQQREPRGGWKSEGEVFRRAPFPINP